MRVHRTQRHIAATNFRTNRARFTRPPVRGVSRPSARDARRRRTGVALFTAAVAILFGAMLTAASALAEKTPPTYRITRLDDRLFRITGGEAGGVLVLMGRRGLLLVDSEDAANAQAFDSTLRSLSKLPVRVIVNTHYHYDHVGGNGRYKKKGARVIAQSNMWAQAAKDTVVEAWGNWHRVAAPADAKPTETFDDSLTLAFEGDTIELRHVPAAHTDDDVMVWLPRHNVLHTGDVVEVGATPFIDVWAGGSVAGFFNGVDMFLATGNDSTRYVPGHGNIIGRAQLVEYRKMLESFANIAAESVDIGRSLQEFLDLHPGAEYEPQFGKRGVRNLAALMYYALNGMRE